MNAVAPIRTFRVDALWDSEAEVFYSDSDIPGLCIEAATFEEFVELADYWGPEMISDNLRDVTGPYQLKVTAIRELAKSSA